ncbi:MAG: threonine transporter RhtB [Rhodoferax sp.]|nr:threonine transporter RhtB [Rhodoferax sp.]
MPLLDSAISFFGIACLLGLTPGPDNLFVLMHSAVQGRRSGMLVVLGLCTGLLVHTAAVALGLAAVFATSALAFTVLKLFGAAYLVWLAWQAWRAPDAPAQATTSAAGDQSQGTGAWRAYGKGVLMNITNPKVAIFFLAFLPQFADPAQGGMVLQLLSLGGIFILATLLTFSVIAYFSGVFGAALRRSPRAQRVMNRVAAVVFLGLAARLSFVQR